MTRFDEETQRLEIEIRKVQDELEAYKREGPEKVREELMEKLKSSKSSLVFYERLDPKFVKDNEEHDRDIRYWSERESEENKKLHDYLGVFHKNLENLERKLGELLIISDMRQADKTRVEAEAELVSLREEFERRHKPVLQEARKEAWDDYVKSISISSEASREFEKNQQRVHQLETRILAIDTRLEVVIQPIFDKFDKLLRDRVLESKTTKVKRRLEYVEGKIPGTQARVDILKEQIRQLEAEKSSLVVELEQAEVEGKVLLARRNSAYKLPEAANARYWSFQSSIPKSEKEFTKKAEDALALAEAEFKRLQQIYLDN